MEQLGESAVAEQERLAAVEDDRETRLLASGLFDEPVTDGGSHLSAHALRLSAPGGVRSVVDVAVGAVEVAPTRGLDEDRVHPSRGIHDERISRAGYRPRLCRLCTRS